MMTTAVGQMCAAAAAAASRVGAETECRDRKTGGTARVKLYTFTRMRLIYHTSLRFHITLQVKSTLKAVMEDTRRWTVAFKQAPNLITKLCILKCRPGESEYWLVKEVGRSLNEPQ